MSSMTGRPETQNVDADTPTTEAERSGALESAGTFHATARASRDRTLSVTVGRSLVGKDRQAETRRPSVPPVDESTARRGQVRAQFDFSVDRQREWIAGVTEAA
jgi:hypothetical protein